MGTKPDKNGGIRRNRVLQETGEEDANFESANKRQERARRGTYNHRSPDNSLIQLTEQEEDWKLAVDDKESRETL